jgi:hypothetical protein
MYRCISIHLDAVVGAQRVGKDIYPRPLEYHLRRGGTPTDIQRPNPLMLMEF